MDSRIYILTHKQLTGQLSSLEHDEYRKLSLNPELKAISDEIAYLWKISNNYFPSKDWKKEEAKDAFLKKIRSTPATVASTASKSGGYQFNWKLGIAIAAIVLFTAWALISLLNRPEVIQAGDQIEYAEILDNTRIWLDNEARLTIIKKTDSERKVALEGEAFFDVQHDPSRLFIVDLGNQIFAEVLGTAFKAKSTHLGDGGQISVREGSVRLYSTSNPDYDLTLKAGEEGVINPVKNVARTSVQSAIRPLMTQSGQLSFDNTPLNEVLDKLGLHFGVQFTYDSSVISNCRYSAGVPANASLEQTLLGIQSVHEGLLIQPENRSTYRISGSCK